jgi:hypothetical protein
VRGVWRAGLACVWLLAACVEPIVSLNPGARSYTAGDYERVYERWTRGQRGFDFGRLKTVLNVTATFESRDFRWAYVVRYGEDFGLPPDARTSMLSASLADAEQRHRFFVTLGDGRPRDIDLTANRGGWRVLLLDDRGRQSSPIEVERLKKATAAERIYFPSVSSFRQAFRLVFPVHHEDGHPTLPHEALFAVLRFTGPAGQVDLKWEFEPKPQRRVRH